MTQPAIDTAATARIAPSRRAYGGTELHGLLTRDSTGPRWMVAPGPSMAQLRVAICAALRAPDHERMCAGGALTNFLNALHLMRFEAKTLSWRKCDHPAIRNAFCVAGEVLARFVCIGTTARQAMACVKDDPDAVLSSWRRLVT